VTAGGTRDRAHDAVHVVTPGDTGTLGGILAEAHATGAVVDVRGHGTRGPLGALGARPDVALRTAGLDRVLAHDPADMTLVCEAGTSLAALDARLAEHGQWLPAQAYRHTGTVGGLLASGTLGALALAHGATREVLIGARFALADGRVARARGRVVKNVAGYDLARLLSGSLNTLAVLVEANLRVHPRPAVQATARVPCADLGHAARLEAVLRRARLTPVLLDVVRDAHGDGVLLGVDGLPARVEGLLDRARAALGEADGRAELVRLDDDEALAARRRADDPRAWLPDGRGHGLLAEVRTATSAVHTLTQALRDLAPRGARGLARAALGELRLGALVDDAGAARDLARAWRAACAAGPRPARLVLLEAPDAVRAEPDLVFGPPPASHAGFWKLPLTGCVSSYQSATAPPLPSLS